MTIQRTPGAFRAEPASAGQGQTINLYDPSTNSAAFESAWTEGATLIDAVQVSPKQNQSWTLLSISFQTYLGIVSLAGQTFGKFGKMLAGIMPPAQQANPTNGGSGVPYVTPFIPLPNDTSLFQTVWDPAIDPDPPSFITFGPGTPITSLLPISSTIALPQPIALVPGDSLAIGLWLMPSLLGTDGTIDGLIGLFAQYSSYTITYDDGL